MRKVSVDDLKGNEILAKALLSDMELLIMTEGTVLKNEYVLKLKELGINYVYIEDELFEGVEIEDKIIEKIKSRCQNTVKTTLEKYAYGGNAELEKIKLVAEEIMCDILEQPKVMLSIYSIRMKSDSEYSHSINVCALATIIALKMKISKAKAKEIAIGSLLHDIGYKDVVANYKGKIYSELEHNELIEVMKHVLYGYSIVEKEDWLSTVSKDIILSHHEKIDGTGYPFKLKGDRIKIGSKIVSVCDKFDRMVYGFGENVYKVHEVIDFIMSKSGVWYDSQIVKAFIESVAAYPTGEMVLTNEGEIGVVIRQNNGFPTRPVIRIIEDKKGKCKGEPIIKDLTKNLTIFIRDTVEKI